MAVMTGSHMTTHMTCLVGQDVHRINLMVTVVLENFLEPLGPNTVAKTMNTDAVVAR